MTATHCTFIAFHNDYNSFSIGLFSGNTCLEKIIGNHKQACSTLLPTLQYLLEKNGITLQNLDFIAAHQGPGPYTTLRITLSIADGIAWATKIPLVGVDGFSAFLHEIKGRKTDYTIILLNAFCGEVYYAIQDQKTAVVETGYLPANRFAEKIAPLIANGPQKILFAGNGVPFCEKELTNLKNLVFEKIDQEAPSIEAIGLEALRKWEQGTSTSAHLLPLYLKQPICTMTASSPSQQG